MPTPEIYEFLEKAGRTRELIKLKSEEKKATTVNELYQVLELWRGIVSTLKEKR